MNLHEKAAKMARTQGAPRQGPAPAGDRVYQEPAEELPDIEVDVPEGGPEVVPVHVAWSRVMDDIRKISKSEKYDDGRAKYDFRSADRTVNVFGPVLRRHGVLVLPVKVEANYRDARTSGGKPTKETTVVVSWLVMGPAGDQLPMLLQSAGEALDSSDKGTAKAQTVAQRVLLLTAAQVPTGDPDPDSQHIERGEAAVRPAASYVDEVADPRTSFGRLKQIHFELRQAGQLGQLVTNEVGDEESIGDMVVRIGHERRAAGGDDRG